MSTNTEQNANTNTGGQQATSQQPQQPQSAQPEQKPADATRPSFFRGWIAEDGKLNKGSYDNLPDDMKPYRSTLEKYDSIETLLRAGMHRDTLVGKKGLMPLEENAPEGARKEFDSRLREVLRVPEKPEGYGIKRPEAFDEKLWDGEYAKQVSEIMHKHAISPSFAKEIVEHNVKYAQETVSRIEKEQEVAAKEYHASQMKELEAAFGTKVPEALKAAERGASLIGLDVNDPAVSQNANLVKAFVRLSDLIGEDKKQMAASGAVGKTPNEEMSAFTNSPLWAALKNPMSAEHPRAQREFSRIAQLMAGANKQ